MILANSQLIMVLASSRRPGVPAPNCGDELSRLSTDAAHNGGGVKRKDDNKRFRNRVREGVIEGRGVWLSHHRFCLAYDPCANVRSEGNLIII